MVMTLAAATLASPAPAAPAANHGALATFAGTWIGHTRSLVIKRDGSAKESIGDGCCNPVIDLRLRLSRPHATASGATATARVTAVDVHDRSLFSKKHPPPRVGESRRIRVKHGVIHERITGTTYCGRPAARKGVCGA